MHCFYTEICIVNQKLSLMNKRIIYVGTLIDLAMIFEPDEEEKELEEVEVNIIHEIRYGYEDKY